MKMGMKKKKNNKTTFIIDDVKYDFSDPEYEQRIFYGYIEEKLDKPMEG